MKPEQIDKNQCTMFGGIYNTPLVYPIDLVDDLLCDSLTTTEESGNDWKKKGIEE